LIGRGNIRTFVSTKASGDSRDPLETNLMNIPGLSIAPLGAMFVVATASVVAFSPLSVRGAVPAGHGAVAAMAVASTIVEVSSRSPTVDRCWPALGV
jgi:hypothetical protein